MGIDICECGRLKTALERSPFLREQVFSASEFEYSSSALVPEQHLAARWAAKEALLKACGLSVLGYDLSKLEVVHESSGRPRLQIGCPELQSDLREAAGTEAYEIHLSLSHERDYAVACVMVTP